MKGKVNSKFFEANNKKEGLKSLSHVCKEGRRSGTLNMSNRSLLDVPMIIFSEVLDDDEKFWEINPYTKLDLSFNQLISFECYNGLNKLKCLYINNNQLTSVKNVQNLANLESLYLDDNLIETYYFNGLFKLKWLTMQNNRIVLMSNEEIVDEIKNFMLSFFKIYNLEELRDGVKNLSLHIHDRPQSIGDTIYVCDHN